MPLLVLLIALVPASARTACRRSRPSRRGARPARDVACERSGGWPPAASRGRSAWGSGGSSHGRCGVRSPWPRWRSA
ncbi:hypothetical protein ACFQVA_26630 [Actinomadura keratinilytica]